MKTQFIKIAIASLIISGLALPAYAGAQADDKRFTAVVKINADQPVDAIYADLTRQVRAACNHQVRSEKSTSIRFHYMKSCSAELLDAVIAKSGKHGLTAFHKSKKSPAQRTLYAADSR